MWTDVGKAARKCYRVRLATGSEIAAMMPTDETQTTGR